MIELLRNIIRIPSLSFQEEAVRDFLSKTLNDYGIPHIIVRNNIIATNKHFDPTKKTLALDAHIDTVPASPQYKRDPFDPGQDEDIIYGLGSNDDGGSVVAMISTFRHFFDKTLPINLALVLSCEEERSGENGARFVYSKNLIADESQDINKSGGFAPSYVNNSHINGVTEHLISPHQRTDESRCIFEENTKGEVRGSGGFAPSYNDIIQSIDWIIFGEPTNMRAATSERGLLVLDAQAIGQSGHAARNEGINALYIALEDILKLRNHEFSRISETMGKVKLNVTQINAGTTHNVIPSSCDFVIDIRPTDAYTNEEILSELQAICKSNLKPRNLKNRSNATPTDSLLYKTVTRLQTETFSSPTTSNWVAINNIEAIKMGPGDSSRSHKADEYILVSEIKEAKEKYIEFINTFCNGYSLE